MPTKLEDISEKELKSFIDDNKPQVEYLNNKHLENKRLTVTITKIMRKDSEYKGDTIENRLLFTDDEKCISLSGKVILDSVDTYFGIEKYVNNYAVLAEKELPITVTFTLISDVSKKDRKYWNIIFKE
jgi:hypothetical protein